MLIIGDEAFKNCSLLTSITIPDSVTSLGGGVFENTAYYNTEGNWENDVLYIGNYLIKAKDTLSGSYTVKAGTLSIEVAAFYDCSSLTEITIPDSVRDIGKSAFYNCSSLTSITMGISVESVGEDAFYGCPIENATMLTTAIDYIPKTYLKTVVLTGGRVIDKNAFHGCTSLTSVTISSGVEWIRDCAFYGCISLTSINIPSSVTIIGEKALYGCLSLTSIIIPNSITSIGEKAFYGCPIENATMPTTAIGYISKMNLKTVVLTGGDSIGGSAFKDCSSLTSVTIPNSVTSIGSYAFYHCNGLISITIPNSVTDIGSWAFLGCSGLTSVTIGSGVTSIGSRAFENCSELTSVTFENTEGWQVCSSSTSTNGTSIPSSDLFNASTAATYLKETHMYYYWKRS